MKFNAPANKSMDVRAKQRLCLETCVVTFNELGGGFAPRHLNRSLFLGKNEKCVKITYLRKILRGLRYCSLPNLTDRRIEVCSLETFESDLFAILGGDLPADSRLVSPDKRHLEIALAKYGLIDVQLSVSSKHLAACSLINGETLRELGFISAQEEKEYVSQNTLETDSEDIGLLDLLVEDVEANDAIIKLFLKTTAAQTPRLSLKLTDDYFPQTFVVEDVCLTNSSYVWLNKHFYL